MTTAEKLEALIQKAIDGGWWEDEETDLPFSNWVVHPNCRDHDQPILCIQSYGGRHYKPQDFIYDHDFAKALWGEEPVEHASDGTPVYDKKGELKGVEVFHQYNWAKHLQKMVISDDPIDYMYQSVFGYKTSHTPKEVFLLPRQIKP